MAMDVGAAAGHSRELSQISSDISYLRGQLYSLQSELNSCWVSGEMEYLNMECENIARKMQEAINELNSLGGDVYTVANEIREEERAEEERLERERLEQERLEQERLAQESESVAS